MEGGGPLVSEDWNHQRPQCSTGEEVQALQKSIVNFTARLDPVELTDEVGVVVAIISPGATIETISSQQEALEAQGFTCETLEAHSVQDAHRLILLVAGFPTAMAYSHTLRPGFPGPSGWFSCKTLKSGEAVRLVCRHWGIVPSTFPRAR